MSRHLLVAGLLAVFAPGPARAQSTPEAAAAVFGNAVKANDWPAAARLMHPAALHQLRTLFEPLLSSPGGDEFGMQLLGVQSGAELAATPDTILFATFLRRVLSQQEGLAEALQTSTFTPLGHVTGGADTVLVVSRMTLTVKGIEISQFDVMPFLLLDGQWRGLLKADFTNMAAMLKRALGEQPS